METMKKIGLTLLCLTTLSLMWLSPSFGAEQIIRGRIEELAGREDIHLPDLKPLVPKMDNRQTPPLNAWASKAGLLKSFPVGFLGTWAGNLQIVSTRLNPVRWKINAVEASRENALLQPGALGAAAFDFVTATPHAVALDPVTVTFRYPSHVLLPTELQQASMRPGPGQQLEPVFSLKLGNISRELTTSGDLLSRQVMKNDLKQLSRNIIEQNIVTYDTNESRDGRYRSFGYTEDVLRFKRLDESKMLVQAVSVTYDQNGMFLTNVYMAGYIQQVR